VQDRIGFLFGRQAKFSSIHPLKSYLFQREGIRRCGCNVFGRSLGLTAGN
jgi:hypothetical protein